ncbi:mechanosensitive ion channel family protein [Candidatus Pacearchaeota archaeon]|nr:mechanosensitive ion channel family protein [Candidatus Pacearchaeota archaeon]
MILDTIMSIVNTNEYTRAGIIFFVLFIFLRIVLYVAEKVMLKLTRKTKTDIDDIILKKSSMPLTFLSLLISIYFALKGITFSEAITSNLNNVLYTLLAVNIGYLFFVIVDNSLIRLWKKFAEKTESDLDDTIGSLVHEVLRITLIVIILIIILKIWGVEITPLLAGLGIAGLAVALALQPLMTNVFSGIALIMDGAFKVGDVIKVGTVMGTVHTIGLRTTRIKTFDNEIVIIPNTQVANSEIQNFFLPDKSIRVNLEFGVAYGVDPEYIKKIVIEEIGKIKFINKEEEIRVLFTEMADSAINFKAMFWVDDISKKWPAHQEAITRVYRRFYSENIEIPYPQSTVWIRDEGKAKSLSPSDKKFSSHNTKLYPAFGHTYKEEEKEKPVVKKDKNILNRFKKSDGKEEGKK